jgi:hypothetical protein
MTKKPDYYDYFIFYSEEYKDGYLTENTNSLEEAIKFKDEEGFTSFEGFNTSLDHFFTGYFFWNDWSDYEDEDEYYILDFVSLEHALIYQECNNSTGHYQFVKSEEWVKGKGIVNTIFHDENLYPNESIHDD